MAKKSLPDPELLRKLLRYDPETGVLTWKVRTPNMFEDGKRTASHRCNNWNAVFAGKPAFTALCPHKYRIGEVLGSRVRAHRVIWALVYGRWPKEVDHINGIRDDNRLSNLRTVTRTQNARNQCIRSTNTSGHMGVSWEKGKHRWVAHIRVDGKLIKLGRFRVFDDAVRARKDAEDRYGFHSNHGRHSAATGGASSSSSSD